MRTFAVSAVIAAALVLGGLFFNMQIDKAAGQMMIKEEEISEALCREDADEAALKTRELMDFVEKKRVILATIIDHGVIDELKVCLAEVYGLCRQNKLAYALVKCGKLEHLIAHIPENYDLTLQNIL